MLELENLLAHASWPQDQEEEKKETARSWETHFKKEDAPPRLSDSLNDLAQKPPTKPQDLGSSDGIVEQRGQKRLREGIGGSDQAELVESAKRQKIDATRLVLTASGGSTARASGGNYFQLFTQRVRELGARTDALKQLYAAHEATASELGAELNSLRSLNELYHEMSRTVRQ